MAEKDARPPRIAIDDLPVIPATQAKNRFGDLLHRVCYEKTPVLVSKGTHRMAVVIDYQEFLELTKKADKQK